MHQMIGKIRILRLSQTPNLMVLTQWMCIPNMKSIKDMFFISRVNGAFLMNVARKRVKRSLKVEFCIFRKTHDICWFVYLVLQMYQIWRL